MVAGKVSSSDMESYNDEAFKNYNEKALDPCPNCGRTFLPDRLVVHLKSCNKAHGKNEEVKGEVHSKTMGAGNSKSLTRAMGGGGGGIGGGDSLSKSFASPQKEIVKPKTLVCYIW